MSQVPDMTHVMLTNVGGRDDLAYHAGAGCLALALACYSASTADLMRHSNVHILENVMLPSVRIWNAE